MSIGKAVLSYLTNFDRSLLEEDIRVLRKALKDYRLGTYEKLADYYGSEGFNNKNIKNFEKLFNQNVSLDNDFRGGLFSKLHFGIIRLIDNLYVMDKFLPEYFSKEITNTSLSYQRFNILRFVELGHFFNEFLYRLAAYSLYLETKEIQTDTSKPLTPIEEKWVIDNQRVFFYTFEIVTIKSKELKKRIEHTSSMIVIPDQVKAVLSTMDRTKTDSLNSNLLPIKLNPIYYIRMNVSEWQTGRYLKIKEEARHIELRILLLKSLKSNQPNAKLEQQIEYLENRIQKLSYKLQKMESS